jgi:hypothetical protein
MEEFVCLRNRRGRGVGECRVWKQAASGSKEEEEQKGSYDDNGKLVRLIDACVPGERGGEKSRAK